MRLQQQRGVGPMVATALIVTVGDARHYKNSRQMAAALGLPQDSTAQAIKNEYSGSVNAVMRAYVRC